MNILVRGARQLLTLRGPAKPRRGPELRELGIIRDGAVLIEDGRIQEVGPSRRIENLIAARGAREINATGRVVLPGFVDSHTHLICGPPWLDEYEARIAGRDASELAGLEGTIRQIQTDSARRLEARARVIVESMVRHGTTTLEAKSGYGRTRTGEVKILRVLAMLDRRPLDVVATFLAAGGRETRDVSRDLHLLGELPRRKLARFADVVCDGEDFDLDETRRYLSAARQQGMWLKVHAGFAAGGSGVKLALEFGAVSADHLEYIGEDDITALARSNTIATLLPGSPYYLEGRYAPARALIESGAAVALGTNFNPHTSPTCNMQMIISLACSRMAMTPAEAVSAATINAAHAVRRETRVGSLEPGKDADLIILNAADYREIPYHFGVNQVHMTIKRGAEIYREGVIQGAAS